MINKSKAIELHKEIGDLLKGEQLFDAINSMRLLASESCDWVLRSEFENIENNYKLMLRCMRQNMTDPQRGHMYTEMLQKAQTLNDRLYRAVNILNNNDIYCQIIRELRKESYTSSLSTLIEWAESISKDPKSEELLNTKIFNFLWTSDIWKQNERYLTLQLLDTNIFKEDTAAIVISAVTLALTEMYDPQKLLFLMEAYSNPSPVISMRAIIGIVITCIMHDNRIMHNPEINSHLLFLNEEPHFKQDIQHIQLQLLQSRETEKINKFMHEELIPEMLKNPLLKKDKTGLDTIQFEESLNPEWKKWAESKQVKKKINTINELYFKGADIHMASFSNMKNFPFFRNICHWFLPFGFSHLSKEDHRFEQESEFLWGKSIEYGEFCDSDKYSICLLLTSLSKEESYRELSKQMSSLGNELKEHFEELHHTLNLRENISKRYIQDLYRFFKLFPRKHEFNDIFEEEINLQYCVTMLPVVEQPEIIRETALSLFDLKHYEEAEIMFCSLNDFQDLTFEEYQQFGFCLQQLQRYEEAIIEYEKADLIQSDNLWTITHLAQCYALDNHPEKAIEYYKRAELLAPNDLQIPLQTGNLLAKQGEYEEAFKRFFKVHYLDEHSVVVWRAIAWYSLLAGKMEQAERFYRMIEERNISSNETDLLNIGHFHWKNNRYKEAISYYRQCHDLVGAETFKKMIFADADDLMSIWIAPTDIPLIIDLVTTASDDEQE